MGLHCSSPSGGTFCPKQGAWYFTPNQNCGNCGLGLWGGSAHRPRSQPRLLRPFYTPEPLPRGRLYALKWRVFTSWCSDHQLDPVNCPVGTVLEFPQERFTAGLSPPTLKVYVVAIVLTIFLWVECRWTKTWYLVSSMILWGWGLHLAPRCRHGIWPLSPMSVAPLCLEFSPGMVKAFLHPGPGYVPKVPANVARSIML